MGITEAERSIEVLIETFPKNPTDAQIKSALLGGFRLLIDFLDNIRTIAESSKRNA